MENRPNLPPTSQAPPSTQPPHRPISTLPQLSTTGQNNPHGYQVSRPAVIPQQLGQNSMVNPPARLQRSAQLSRMNPSVNTNPQSISGQSTATVQQYFPDPTQIPFSRPPALQDPNYGTDVFASPLDPYTPTRLWNAINRQPTNVATGNMGMYVSTAGGNFDAAFSQFQQTNNIDNFPGSHYQTTAPTFLPNLYQQTTPSMLSTDPHHQSMLSRSLNPQLAALMPSTYMIRQPNTQQFMLPANQMQPSSFDLLQDMQQPTPVPTPPTLPANHDHDSPMNSVPQRMIGESPLLSNPVGIAYATPVSFNNDNTSTDDEDEDDDTQESENEVQKLLRMRDVLHLSFKDIKRLGNFKQTESTLRGKYRCAKKSREERPRRPTLSRAAEDALQALVRGHIARIRGDRRQRGLQPLPLDKLLGKIVWKNVADELAGLGHHLYGGGTLKKKYLQLRGLLPS